MNRVEPPLTLEEWKRYLRTPIRMVRAVAFWTAVSLPVVHLLNVVTGLHSSGDVALFTSLLALNLLALAVGHEHNLP